MKNNTDPRATQRNGLITRLQLTKQLEFLGKPTWEKYSNAAYDKCQNPAITVLITLYNYASYIEECLTSIFNSNLYELDSPIEILVIDDCSTDSSRQKVLEELSRISIPMCLINKLYNTGLGNSRNLGLKLARAPYVFILDADNWIYPRCLPELYRAIVDKKLAATYSIIKRFDSKTGKELGLLSQFQWDRRELVRLPYIDAMALLDRSIVLGLGGYSEELLEYGWMGWEDYDLWLKLAQANYDCELVPQILAAYRVQAGGMLNSTNMYAFSIISYLGTKFSNLADVFEDLDQYFGLAPAYEGVHSSTDPEYLIGWAWDRHWPNKKIGLDLYDHDRLIDKILANGFRSDLYELGMGNGWYGFVHPLPQILKDGKPHLLKICFAGTKIQLSETLQWITCASAKPSAFS